MDTKMILSLILLIIPVVFSQYNRYCQLKTCPNESHTLCQFPVCKFGEKCVNPVSAGFTADDIKSIVNYHNYFRWSHLLDQKFELLLAVPSYMLLKWDTELAMVAQRWADQCEYAYDKCRNIERFNVTQRVDVRQSLAHEGPPSLAASINMWAEQDKLDALNFQHLNLESGPSLHLTALTWGYNNYVGCGYVRTFDQVKYTAHFVCNYGYKAATLQ